MSEHHAAELGRVVEQLAAAEDPLTSEALGQFTEHLARAFRVKTDEVAILALTGQGRSLRFIVPEKLRNVGTIPMSSMHSVAVRTARENRAEILNNFNTTRHLSVFEGVPLGRSGESIQKMMSVPVTSGQDIVGVVQISRKGLSPEDAGPDFTPKELRELKYLSGVLSRFVQLFKFQ